MQLDVVSLVASCIMYVWPMAVTGPVPPPGPITPPSGGMETTMSIRTIKDTDTFSSTFDYDAKSKHATVEFSVRAKDGEPRHVLKCDIDYSGLSQVELVELAQRGVTIDLQRQWRVLAATKGSTARTANPFAKVNVKAAIVDASRKVATPMSRAMSALAKMTAKEKEELLKALQAK